MRVNETLFVVLIGILWVVITVMGSAGLWFPALLLSVVLIALQTILGLAHEGRASGRLVGFLIVPWALLWIVAFVLAQHHAAVAGDTAPAFTILGMHPSFAWIVLLYWLAASVVVCAGFLFLSDDWLSGEQWEGFKSRIAELNERAGEGHDG